MRERNSIPSESNSFTLRVGQLKTLVQQWQREAEEAAKESKTQKVPRTYDKALKLLVDLEAMLLSSFEEK